MPHQYKKLILEHRLYYGVLKSHSQNCQLVFALDRNKDANACVILHKHNICCDK
jgi:hypothetical protein